MNKFRVIMIPKFPSNEDGFGVTDITYYGTAKKILDALADYTLHLHKTGLMEDFSNVGFIEKYENGEWIEYDELEA